MPWLFILEVHFFVSKAISSHSTVILMITMDAGNVTQDAAKNVAAGTGSLISSWMHGRD